jgi:valyl-tRNA synthetase
MEEFEKKYNPKQFETEIYKKWEKDDKFKPKNSSSKKTFYIPMPPPNVTWNLHLWHALTNTVQDIMIRYHRLKWDITLWVPGTDHAWIATQSVVEKKLAKNGIKKTDLWREKFIDEVWKWKDEYANNINSQIRLMWASCDWSKERFTLDEWLNKLVEYVFCDLYEKKLIYRWEYMVNYSPILETVISDIEVNYQEEKANLYYITYFLKWSDKELVIATTRPETMLADQAIAVHPKDKRYRKLIGRKIILPILNKEIPIIWDEIVDIEFGTWALKITPAHDAIDFSVGKKHNLKLDYSVIDKNWIMNHNAWIFNWQNCETARENIVELLKAKWNLVKIEPYTHKVWYCSRSWAKIETIISTQWFVNSSELAKNVIKWYKKNEFKIIPEKFNKIFENWIYNLKDWCISRQLWWWHQIPAYYDINTWKLLEVTTDEKKVFKKYGKDNVKRDDDVLDTWFSSALWPFSILDWDPKKPWKLFNQFYPAQVLETWHDIIFFWVIRMLLMGYEYTKKTPFKNIYLHWLILDEKGKKMSKSIWNIIDPVEIINQYSTDALRLSLIIWNTPWNNLNFSIKAVESNSLFLNKLWNVTRFVHSNVWEIKKNDIELLNTINKNYDKLLNHEKWIISRLKNVFDIVTDWMENFNFSIIWFDLINFTKDEFADFYIEEYKLTKENSKYWDTVLSFCILTLLKLWHPYIPFITEELYWKLKNKETLIDNTWPKWNIKRNILIEKDMCIISNVIRTVRNIRAEKLIKPQDKVDVIFRTTKKFKTLLETNQEIIYWLAKIKNLFIVEKNKDINWSKYAYWVIDSIDIFVDTWDIIDSTDEKERLKLLICDKKEYIRIINFKLLNANFVKKAPESLVRIEQEKKLQAEEQLKKLEEKYKTL